MVARLSNLHFQVHGGSVGKESACNEGDPGPNLWRRKWQPSLVSLSGEFNGEDPAGLLSMGYQRVGHD